jgi:DNA-binding transcriptional LysR family regulator
MDIALRNVIPSSGPLVCRRVGELAGCVYASELYLEGRGTPKGRDELVAHDLLAYEGMAGMPGFEWISDERWTSRVVFRAGDPVGLTSAIAAGLGLGAVPCILGETSPTLRRIESLGVGFSPLYVITHERNHATPRIRAVIQFLEEVLRNNGAVLMGRGVDTDPR